MLRPAKTCWAGRVVGELRCAVLQSHLEGGCEEAVFKGEGRGSEVDGLGKLKTTELSGREWGEGDMKGRRNGEGRVRARL